MIGFILGRIAYVPAVTELLEQLFSTDVHKTVLMEVGIPKRFVGRPFKHLVSHWTGLKLWRAADKLAFSNRRLLVSRSMESIGRDPGIRSPRGRSSS